MAKVLIIEDSEELRDMLVTFMQRMGHETAYTDNGLDGVKMAKALVPDLIILDLMMPVASGDLTLGFIRSTEPLKRTPVIVTSAHPSAEAIAEKLDANCMRKPFGFHDLKALMEQLLKPAV